MSRRLLGKDPEKRTGLVSRLAWGLAFILAAGAYHQLDRYAERGKEYSAGMSHGGYEGYASLHVLASFGRFLIPAMVILAALYSLYRRRKRMNLLVDTARGKVDMQGLSKSDFKYLVGEYFHERGFEVEEHASLEGKDTALFVRKQRERYLVLPVHGTFGSAVEALQRAVYQHGATGGILVASGSVADEVRQVAKSQKIGLMDGRELQNRIRSQVQAVEGESGSKTAGKNGFRVLIVWLLVLSLAVAGLMYTEQGRHVQNIALRQIERFVDLDRAQYWVDSVKRAVSGEEEKELVFTEEQVEEAMREVMRQKKEQLNEASGELEPQPRYRYEIELHSGGWIYTDNVDIDKQKITYTSRSGLEVSLNRDEISTLKQVRVD